MCNENKLTPAQDLCGKLGDPTPSKFCCVHILVEKQKIMFIVDTESFANPLPAGYAPTNYKPYVGSLKMWNQAITKPQGECNKDVTKPLEWQENICSFCNCV